MARRPPSTQWGSCDRPLQHDADAQPGPSSSPGLLHLDPGDGEQTSVVDMASIGVRAAYNLEAAAALVPDSTELDRTQLKCTSHLAMASTMLSRSSFTALARSSLPLRAAPLTAARATAVAFAQQKTSFATSAPTMAQQGTSAGWPIAVLSQEQVSRVPLHSTLLFAAKKQKNLSFETIAQALGRDEVACAALFYGQAKASEEDMANLSKLLEIPLEQLQATEMTGMPDRGRTLGDLPPKEPLIYRLFEIVQNYGYAYKAVLNEKFGDGIMSAITFSTHVEKETDEKGDWVKITLRGKWLPYSRF